MVRKILAIDDSLTFRKFISKTLSGANSDYEIALAKDGEEGIAMAAESDPELVLLDYVLPDLTGDEVCARFSKDDRLKNKPIVLMSSSADKIAETEARYPSVRKSIAKPFTPELLCDTVRDVLSMLNGGAPTSAEAASAVVAGNNGVGATAGPIITGNAAASATTASSGETIIFSGHTSTISLLTALQAVQRQKLTGLLKFTLQSDVFNLACAEGVPLSLLRANYQPVGPWADQARIFARFWTTGVAFSFEARRVPLAAATSVGPVDNMLDFAAETLRFVGEEAESAHAWGDSTGIAAFTRTGFERIQRIALTDEEINFVKEVDARSTLVEIADRLNVPVERTQRVLFRFLALEIFDFWPAAILRGQR